MILMDTETTALAKESIAKLAVQPRIIELSAWKINEKTLKVEEKYHALMNPGIPIPPEVTKITGLTDEMVKGKKGFAGNYIELARFILGEWTIVAHNLPYDRSVLAHELARIDRALAFPWPPHHICTVEQSQDIRGHYLSLSDLYAHYYGSAPGQIHRADSDVEILYKVVCKMRKEGRL